MKTGKKVAKIAGRMLNASKQFKPNAEVLITIFGQKGKTKYTESRSVGTNDEFQAVLASVLKQRDE